MGTVLNKKTSAVPTNEDIRESRACIIRLAIIVRCTSISRGDHRHKALMEFAERGLLIQKYISNDVTFTIVNITCHTQINCQ